MQRRKRTYNIANTSLKLWQILMTLAKHLAKHLAKRISIHDIAEALQKVWIYLSSCIHVLNAFVMLQMSMQRQQFLASVPN